MNTATDSLLTATFTSLLTGLLWTLTATVEPDVCGEESGSAYLIHVVTLRGATCANGAIIDFNGEDDDADEEALSLALGFGAWDARYGCDEMRDVINPLFVEQYTGAVEAEYRVLEAGFYAGASNYGPADY